MAVSRLARERLPVPGPHDHVPYVAQGRLLSSGDLLTGELIAWCPRIGRARPFLLDPEGLGFYGLVARGTVGIVVTRLSMSSWRFLVSFDSRSPQFPSQPSRAPVFGVASDLRRSGAWFIFPSNASIVCEHGWLMESTNNSPAMGQAYLSATLARGETAGFADTIEDAE